MRLRGDGVGVNRFGERMPIASLRQHNPHATDPGRERLDHVHIPGPEPHDLHMIADERASPRLSS